VEEEGHPLRKPPEDYALFWIGEWNEEDGTFGRPEGTPARHVADCWTLQPKMELV